MANTGIIEIDVHGMTAYQARICIESAIKKAGKATYRIRVIHGYHGGTALRELVREQLSHNPKVLRIEIGTNPGETDLILREII